MQHCFSIDVEGFREGSYQCCGISPAGVGSVEEQSEIATNVAAALELLAECQIQATFFCLGSIARRQPAVVRAIVAAGHELASHSLEHQRLFSLSRSVAKEFIASSKKLLEDVSGSPVLGFRAPEFSISADSLELLDLIQSAGYVYDSSIYPISGHDVYGIKNARRDIHQLSNGLWEFPPTTIRWLGKNMPALGGGYLRLLPNWINRAAILAAERDHRPAMLYVHPYEIGPTCPSLSELTYYRKFRRYFGRARVPAICRNLCREFSFTTASSILSTHGMKMPTIQEPQLFASS